MILVSACLAGKPCRYDGSAKPNPEVIALLDQLTAGKDYLLICPETAGGLPRPRSAGEIEHGNASAVLDGSGRVDGKNGEDYTAAFLQGAQAVLKTALDNQATVALLKERSPSCGVTEVYDGSFSGSRIPGQGVCTCLLARNGFTIFSEEMLTEFVDYLNKHLDEKQTRKI